MIKAGDGGVRKVIKVGPGGFALTAGLAAAAIGLAVLIGWTTGPDLVTWVIPGAPRMMPLAAAGVTAAGLAVALLALAGPAGHATRALARVLGALVGLLGLAVLAQYVASQDLGIDRLLLFDAARERVASMPGRPSPHTAVAFVLTGAAIALAGRPGPGRPVRATDVLCCLAACIPYAALIGYMAGSPEFNRISPAIGMAVPTAVAFLLLIAGLLAARPDQGIAAMVTARTTGGMMLRRLLPMALLVPPVLAHLRVIGQRAGLFETPAGIGLLTLAISGISLIALFTMSSALNRVELAYRRKAEQVERSEALLRAILDSASDAIYVKDRHGHYIMMNRAGAEPLGKSPDEVIARTAEDLFPPEIARAYRFNDLSVIQSGRPFTFEDKFEAPGGVSRTLLTVVSPFRFDGQVSGVVGVSRDITERHEAEAAIRANEAKYRSLLEAAPDAVFVVDREDRIVLANSQAEQVFGYSRNDLLGRPLQVLVPGVDLGRRIPEISDPQADSGTCRISLEMALQGLRRDGTPIDVEVSLSPARAGNIVLITAIIRDVTERKRIQAEIARRTAEAQAAREAAHLKDVFLSSMSHEMKTPLSLIVGYAELLDDRTPGDPLVEGILDGTSRLMHHIDSLLLYSALLSDALPLYRTDTCVGELVRDAISIVEPAIASREQKLACRLDPGAPSLPADARRLSQVLQALLEDASRFSPRGGKVAVQVKGGPDAVEISVKDNGVGMSEQDLARIWEPFGQARVGDTDRTGGLGLGLKIARKLVELHGGTISILSEPGRGTTATVVLPLLAENLPQAPGAAASRCAGSAQPGGGAASRAATTESRMDVGTSGMAPGR